LAVCGPVQHFIIIHSFTPNMAPIAVFGPAGTTVGLYIPIKLKLKFGMEEYTIIHYHGFTLARQFSGGVWPSCGFCSDWGSLPTVSNYVVIISRPLL